MNKTTIITTAIESRAAAYGWIVESVYISLNSGACVVLVKRPDYNGPAGREYSTHRFSLDGGFYSGVYDLTLESAREDFMARINNI